MRALNIPTPITLCSSILAAARATSFCAVGVGKASASGLRTTSPIGTSRTEFTSLRCEGLPSPMDTQADRPDPQAVAAQIAAEIRALPVVSTPAVRAIRRRYSQALKGAAGPFMLDLGRELAGRYGYRWVAYELIAAHRAAYGSLGAAHLEELGQGMEDWGAVDGLARTLSGPAWRDGLLADEVIHRWARSGDRWWRRAALVSTVALNMRSHGGRGDTA
ncbi:MAG: hypothetical protein EHM39_08270, partial [Chloroflexi bacterium]